MRKLFVIALMAITYSTHAAPYVEYKRTEKINPHASVAEYMRAGYEYRAVYLEIGKDSAEAGYKWKPVKNLVVKGKAERIDGKVKLENEIRYTFKK
jgi:hypothetical protein